MVKHILEGWSRFRRLLTPKTANLQPSLEIDMEVALRVGELATEERKAGWSIIRRRPNTMRVEDLECIQGTVLGRLTSADKLGFLPDTRVKAEGPLSEAMAFLHKIARRSWDKLKGLYYQATGVRVIDTSLPSMCEKMGKLEQAAWTIVFVVYSWYTWKDRCKLVYEGSPTQTPTKVILSAAEDIAANLVKTFSSSAKKEAIQTAKHQLATMQAILLAKRIGRNREITSGAYSEQGAELEADRSVSQARRTARGDADEGRQPKERHAEKNLAEDPLTLESSMDTTPPDIDTFPTSMIHE
ncbi:hypothetical protein R1sor_000649 [Riccia sorocarpa]|uniref:Uncharacterized protein n=1 Tax=Riccia sorocarpa TaxID=122646 RepID=A0ABD3GWT3_9MARC